MLFGGKLERIALAIFGLSKSTSSSAVFTHFSVWISGVYIPSFIFWEAHTGVVLLSVIETQEMWAQMRTTDLGFAARTEVPERGGKIAPAVVCMWSGQLWVGKGVREKLEAEVVNGRGQSL